MQKIPMNFRFQNWSFIVVLLSLLSIFLAEAKKQNDGNFAKLLDENLSTIKCVVNILEHTLPKLDEYVACCAFWTMHDWLIKKIDEECEPENLDKVRNLSGLVSPHIRDHCGSYQSGTFSCRMLVIMPITLCVLFIIFLLVLFICANVSLVKWIRVRRKYRRVMNIKNNRDSAYFIRKKFSSNNEDLKQDNGKTNANDYA